jgi:hypothetical protein
MKPRPLEKRVLCEIAGASYLSNASGGVWDATAKKCKPKMYTIEKIAPVAAGVFCAVAPCLSGIRRGKAGTSKSIPMR